MWIPRKKIAINKPAAVDMQPLNHQQQFKGNNPVIIKQFQDLA